LSGYIVSSGTTLVIASGGEGSNTLVSITTTVISLAPAL